VKSVFPWSTIRRVSCRSRLSGNGHELVPTRRFPAAPRRRTGPLPQATYGPAAHTSRDLEYVTDVGDEAGAKRIVLRTKDTSGRLDAAFNDARQSHIPAPLAGPALADFGTTLLSAV
jgi:hypothetical protein